MTTSELITYILKHKENITSGDADYAARRERVLNELQVMTDDITCMRDWWWRRVNNPVSITALAGDGFAVVPSDFDSMGRKGQVIFAPDGYTLNYLEEDEMAARKASTSYDTDKPHFYSVFGIDRDGVGGGQATYRQLIQIDNNSSAVSLKITYNTKFPTLTDAQGQAADSDLLLFPPQYHLRVLVPAVEARLAMQRGEMNQQQYEAQLAQAVTIMLRNERPSQAHARGLRGHIGGAIR